MRKPKAFDSWTKEDQESWLARFREKRREEARNRREDNPEKDRERCRKYREENTEKIRERDRARSKKYYWENREACRERVRKWVSEKRKEEGWTPKKVGRKPNPSPDPDSYYYKMKAIKSDPAKWADHLKAKEEKKARSKELRKAKHNERSKRRYRRIRESEGKIVGVPRKKMSDDERKAKNVQKNKLWKIRNPKKVAAQWERRRERERETGTGRENRKTPEYKKRRREAAKILHGTPENKAYRKAYKKKLIDQAAADQFFLMTGAAEQITNIEPNQYENDTNKPD